MTILSSRVEANSTEIKFKVEQDLRVHFSIHLAQEEEQVESQIN